MVSQPAGVAAALPPVRGGINPLHVSPELTILNIVWAPHMTLAAHDHRMWAAIALYSGGEDNAFYRRDEPGLVESGGKSLRPRDVCLLGAETIHAVTNPTTEYAGAIHVYGGDFFATRAQRVDGRPAARTAVRREPRARGVRSREPRGRTELIREPSAGECRAAVATRCGAAGRAVADGLPVRGLDRVVGVHADRRVHEVAVGDRVDRDDLDVGRRAGRYVARRSDRCCGRGSPTGRRGAGRAPRTWRR